MKEHRARAGDCFTSIAYEHGFFWQTLWDHEDNAALKEQRKDPFTLIAGEDLVRIPDLRLKEEACATEKRHTFRRRGVPAKLRLRLLQSDGQPRANEEYFFEVEGKMVSTAKTTDGDGRLEELIPPNARRGRLLLQGGAEVHQLSLGELPPADTIAGLKARLASLGFLYGRH